MRIVKIFTLSLLLCITAVLPVAYGQNKPVATTFAETPAKTIVIKHPAANDVSTFFATTMVFEFEVYKAGTKADIDKIVSILKKDNNIENCGAGSHNGDYQSFSFTLKATKDKAWFAALFKKAGLNTIKINNNPIVEVEKM